MRRKKMRNWDKNRIFGIESINKDTPEYIAAQALAYALSTTRLRKGRIVEASTSGAPVARLTRDNYWVMTRSSCCHLPGSILMRAESYIKARIEELPDEDWARRVCEWLKGHSYDCWKGEEILVNPEDCLYEPELPAEYYFCDHYELQKGYSTMRVVCRWDDHSVVSEPWAFTEAVKSIETQKHNATVAKYTTWCPLLP
jgi:hypothetical protein